MPNFVTHSPQQHAWDYDSYDKTVARLCNALKTVGPDRTPSDKPIPLIFATPERAWGVMRKKFQKDYETDPEFRLPLPFLSVQQIGDTTFDAKRYLYRKILYRRVAVDTDDFRSCLSHARPLPYTFQYSIELWTATRFEARVACAQFGALFDEGGMCYRKVDLGYPLGIKWAPIFLEGMTDNTNLEPMDKERSLRWTFTVRVEGWLSPPIIDQSIVHDIFASIEAPSELCEENIYEDSELEFYHLSRGNPETGEIVDGEEEFTEDYDGVDYRYWRFSPGNACVEV